MAWTLKTVLLCSLLAGCSSSSDSNADDSGVAGDIGESSDGGRVGADDAAGSMDMGRGACLDNECGDDGDCSGCDSARNTCIGCAGRCTQCDSMRPVGEQGCNDGACINERCASLLACQPSPVPGTLNCTKACEARGLLCAEACGENFDSVGLWWSGTSCTGGPNEVGSCRQYIGNRNSAQCCCVAANMGPTGCPEDGP